MHSLEMRYVWEGNKAQENSLESVVLGVVKPSLGCSLTSNKGIWVLGLCMEGRRDKNGDIKIS